MSATIEVCKVQTYVPIDDLKFHPQNPRTIKPERLAELKRSIRQKGFYQPILVWKKEGIVLAGNHRLLAARELVKEGFTFKTADGKKKNVLPVVIEDVSDAIAQSILFESNNTYADWIEDKLREALEDAEASGIDINQFGFTQEYVDSILKSAEKDAEALLSSITPVEEEPSKPDEFYEIEIGEKDFVTKRGMTWLLGSHRLRCGDSTNEFDVSSLMNGEKADMVFTDPPYNLASDGKLKRADAMRSNFRKNYEELSDAGWDHDFDVRMAIKNALNSVTKSFSGYFCTSQYLIADILEEVKGCHFYGTVVWCKSNPMPSLSKKSWTQGHELIVYCHGENSVFNFPESGHALSWWNFNSERHTEDHPTQKPVSIPEHAILHSSRPNSLILDLFGGSGSTLIACEKNSRKCYLMEIEEKYCDMIIKRWQKFTGKRAILEGSGESFDELSAMLKDL